MNLQERLLELAETHDVPARICTGCGRKFYAVRDGEGNQAEQCEACNPDETTTLRATVPDA